MDLTEEEIVLLALGGRGDTELTEDAQQKLDNTIDRIEEMIAGGDIYNYGEEKGWTESEEEEFDEDADYE